MRRVSIVVRGRRGGDGKETCSYVWKGSHIQLMMSLCIIYLVLVESVALQDKDEVQ